jgi:hypothetical protein
MTAKAAVGWAREWWGAKCLEEKALGAALFHALHGGPGWPLLSG